MTHRIQQLHQHYHIQQPQQLNKQTSSDFKDVLSSLQDVKISKHAKQRLEERNIHIDDNQWQLIGEKMSEAKQKGVTDSLVVMNNAALLVSTKNNTVVTAMDREEATTRVFTNINGTILINE
jgi:flagellar operon protein